MQKEKERIAQLIENDKKERALREKPFDAIAVPLGLRKEYKEDKVEPKKENKEEPENDSHNSHDHWHPEGYPSPPRGKHYEEAPSCYSREFGTEWMLVDDNSSRNKKKEPEKHKHDRWHPEGYDTPPRGKHYEEAPSCLSREFGTEWMLVDDNSPRNDNSQKYRKQKSESDSDDNHERWHPEGYDTPPRGKHYEDAPSCYSREFGTEYMLVDDYSPRSNSSSSRSMDEQTKEDLMRWFG